MDNQMHALKDKKQAAATLAEIKTIVESGDAVKLVASYECVPNIMDLTADKDKATAAAAVEVANLIFDKSPAWAMCAVLPKLMAALDGKAKPQCKEAACGIVEAMSKKNPKAMSREIEWVVAKMQTLLTDIKKSVAAAAKTSMTALCTTCGNKDLLDQGFIETIVQACESLKNVDGCVEKLAGCIFVQNVVAPHLSVITPVAWRGLKTKSEAVKRRACTIIDNMCKLIDDPREGAPLLHEIYPLVKKNAEEINDPEAREMAEKTLATIEKMAGCEPRKVVNVREVMMAAGANVMTWSEETSNYMELVGNNFGTAGNFEMADWKAAMGAFSNDKALEACKTKMEKSGEIEIEEFIDDDETQPDLYKGNFSLAYGTLTLLRDCRLHLKKNKFYGLLGPQNCGKTTLMRAISREQVEGFPKRDELVTIFVEHEIEDRELEPPSKEWPLGKFNIDLSGIEFVVDTCNNVYKKQPPVSSEMVEKALGEMGFKNPITKVNPRAAANMLNPITTYSGGWKVKMQLACAKLIEADILMLDEPTGHLDVKNVQWMKDWLQAFPGSIMASSTNSEFLDEVCTHIIDFQDRKLIQFKETKGQVLTKFVEKYPEKSSYFELTTKNMKFIFPQPGSLEGVKSKGRQILKMTNVSFKYPTHEKNTVEGVCLSVCMLSRVGVVGPNGAGKSTAIKLLIGELKQIDGTIFRHSGMRLAYVAQHAFHHLEKHLDKCPTDYILWRFAGNDDRESLENQTKELNVDEEALRAVKWCVDPKSGVVRKCVPGEKQDKPEVPDQILNRRKNKQKKYEYEVKWMFKSIEQTCWVERETLLKMGYEKIVCREDEKQAAAAGLMNRPLTHPSVEKALKDFGLDQESASHNPLHSLSGGQKVKVVLAAAMWQCPHVLILDEPTNYLDRDGLGALVNGLQEFGGGVVIISHNMEFTNSVAQQKWIMEAGRLREEGELQGDEEFETGDGGPEEITDQYGNKIEVNKAKTMTDKERKKAIKEIEKRLKEHKKKNTLSDAEMWELQDKLVELKDGMGGA